MDSDTLSSILGVLRSHGVKSASIPTLEGQLQVEFAPVNVENDKNFEEVLERAQFERPQTVLGPEDMKFPGQL